MKWNFTGQQVLRGEVAYTLEEFRADFYREVQENFAVSISGISENCYIGRNIKLLKFFVMQTLSAKIGPSS